MFLCRRFDFTGYHRPLVMGILNVTPDSFSDGGQHSSLDAARRRADEMVAEGADIIDIGGESTRPGSPRVPLQQELDRVLPVVEALRDCGAAISIDTYKPEVMRAVLSAGADMINDIWGFRQPGAVEAVAAKEAGDAALCVMHMQGDPETMQQDPRYNDVLGEVRTFLEGRVNALEDAGVAKRRIVLDPGFGFGKTSAHNLRLLNRLSECAPVGFPILAGMSRKSMLGAVTGRDAAGRLHGSLAAALIAAERGANVLRVHDVAATVDVLRVAWAVKQEDAKAAY
jgi:dihydropteroate synthase